MKAIVYNGEPGKASLVTDRPPPKIRPGYVLVDVKAVALNPADWKSIDRPNPKGAVVGLDFAGEVAQIGDGYSKVWKQGDRIAGFVNGGNPLQLEDGAFAERIAAKADIAFRIPDNRSFEDFATLPTGILTVGGGLYQEIGLNRPSNPTTTGEYVLIYGGSTATGSLCIQFATLSGYKVISTASKRNHDLLKSLGAVEVFDYNDPDVVEKIKKYTDSGLKYIYDTISLEPTVKICAQVIAPGGTYGAILPVKFPRDDVRTTHNLAYRAIGEPVQKGPNRWDDNTREFDFAKDWIKEAEPLLLEGKIRVHPPKVGQGLAGVFEGLDLLRQDKVSGEKLVYTL